MFKQVEEELRIWDEEQGAESDRMCELSEV